MNRLWRELQLFLCAVQFLTRIPTPALHGFEPDWISRSARYFPLVGLLVGGACAGVFWSASLVWTGWLPALLAIAAGVLITGAFHEDGLADTADGLGGGLTRERALEIMKDSRIGTYGAIALVLALLSKIALLAMLAQVSPWMAVLGLFGAHVVSRLMPMFLIRFLSHVGDTAKSKSKPLADAIEDAALMAGVVWAALALWLLLWVSPGLHWLWALAGSALGMGWMWRLLWRRLQGFTGDGLGATQQLSEVGFYIGLLLALGPLSA